MKTVLVTTPTAPVSDRISSHRAAQGVIYADQIKSGGYKVEVNYAGRIEDYSKYDIVAVYHGNDWGGSLNMYGGVKGYGNIDSLISLSKFKGEVWSLAIKFPKYSEMIKPRLEKSEDSHPDWKKVDWKRLSEIESTAIQKDTNLFIKDCTKIVFGDSHAISMYRPKWMVNSVPFKTLHGALKAGFESFLKYDRQYTDIEIYFGNIDIRHHLCRQKDPDQATKDIVLRYIDECDKLSYKYRTNIKIWEPLPIENESRKLPKTGYYDGTPFYGSWEERNRIRNLFIDELDTKLHNNKGVSLFRWTKPLINAKGELDFESMEKPQSIHLSRKAYPHWQGQYSNSNDTLENFYS